VTNVGTGMGLRSSSTAAHTTKRLDQEMTEVQSPLVDIAESKVGSHDQDKNVLINRLDELLEKYLHTLDEYQRVRELLSKQLSSVSFNQTNSMNRY
jgi:hypothetical protein